VAGGGTLPLAFVNLFLLSPGQLADAFSQLQGEAGTGAAQAGTQAMNSFLSLVTNPFAENRSFTPERPLPPRPPLIYKAPVYKAPASAAPDPRRWSVWAAAYGGQTKTTGDPVLIGSHDRSERTLGYAAGLDYRVTPYTVAGFALGGGRTNFGLSGGFGGGRSDMIQAAVYSVTRVDAAYVSAALAYAWHRVSTDRVLAVAGNDDLTAQFSANNVGGRIEGGYNLAIPGMSHWPGRYGFPLRRRAGAGLPHAVLQRKCRLRLVALRPCLRRAHHDRGPYRAGRLVRPDDRARRRRDPDAAQPRRLGARPLVRPERHRHVRIAAGIELHRVRGCAGARFLALLGRGGDRLQEWDIARRQVRQRVGAPLADLHRYRTDSLYVVIGSTQARRSIWRSASAPTTRA